MTQDPFKTNQERQFAKQVAGMAREQDLAERQHQAKAAQAQFQLGQQAINFLIMLAKKAPDGVLRVSSLVKDRPGPRDGFRVYHDDATNEWKITYAQAPEKPEDPPSAPKLSIVVPK